GYSESSKSAFVSAAAKQMGQLAVAMGAKKETYEAGSQAWFGDLMTTCFGASRNLEFGRMIGSGKAASVAIEEMIANNKSVEGYITAEVLNTLLDRHGVQAPLLKGVYSVLYEGKDAKDFVKNFISVW
ncbi:hypothetical protein KY362_04365, partial [Candidatus Woesearchaeota archaeon]|nr:hypothetical protein [Candidatus Woesearchaeota archaeon]